jgi:hypothetical protein
VTVLPYSGRAFGVTPDSVVDPSAAAARVLSVNGVGFAPAVGSSAGLRIGVMEASVWHSDGNRRAADLTIAASSTVLNVLLTRDNGTFARTLTIPAAAASKLKPDTEYLLVAFSTVEGDRSLDYTQPFVLTGQDFGATAAAPAATELPTSTTAPQRDLGLSKHVVGESLAVTGLVPNSWNYLTVFSEANGLGWKLADASGSVTIDLPSDFELGTHTMQVQNTAGTVIGWQNFVLRAEAGEPGDGGGTPGDGGGTPGDGAGTPGDGAGTPGAGTTGGESTGAGSKPAAEQSSSALPLTGSTAVWWLAALAGLLVLAGAAVRILHKRPISNADAGK